MVQYTCIKCSKIFNHKGKYEKHLSRKTTCESFLIKDELTLVNPELVLSNQNQVLDNTQCCCCYKYFINKSSRIHHEKNSKCFYKKIIADEKIIEDEKIKEQKLDEPLDIHDELKEIKEKNRKLEEKLAELELMLKKGINPIVAQTTNNTNMNNNNILTHTNSHNVQNIVVNMYGKENLTHITDPKLIYIMDRGFMSVSAYILLKYFSDKMPENSNVYSSDIKSKYIMVYDGKRWNIKDKADVIEHMYSVNCEELQDKFYEFKEADRIPMKVMERFAKFINAYEEDHIKKEIKEDIKKILFNEREKSLKNKRIKAAIPLEAVGIPAIPSAVGIPAIPSAVGIPPIPSAVGIPIS